MKHIAIAITAFFTLLSTGANAQTLFLLRANTGEARENLHETGELVCYERHVLDAISNEIFKQGNPNYIWVDLLRDGYVTDGDTRWHILHISTIGKDNKDTLIPPAVQKQYIDKWLRFIAALGEPGCETGSYSVDLSFGVSSKDVANPLSEFRKAEKSDLRHLRLTVRGELRFLNELVKDGLADMNKPLTLDFSRSGFFVMGERLTNEMREKYTNLLIKELGVDYYSNDGNRMSKGALPENTLDKEIARLTARLAQVPQKTLGTDR